MRTLDMLTQLALLCHVVSCSGKVTNWAGNIVYNDALFVEPETVEEVVAIVKANDRVAIVGTRHSFNNISQAKEGVLLSTKKLNKILSCCDNMRVEVQPGITYAELGQYLGDRGYALANYASLPHLSVGGAIATGSHGSGERLGNLATSVRALKFVTAGGEIVHLRREDPLFKHAVVAVGAGGVVVEVSLDVEPAYLVQQCIYTDLPLASLKDHLDDVLKHTYSVSLFTQWQDGGLINSLWRKHKVEIGTDPAPCAPLAGRPASTVSVHPDPTMPSAEACSPPGVGASHVQLPHFLPSHTPSHGDELQTELFVARGHLWEALTRLFEWEGRARQLSSVLFVSEIRFVASDGLSLSPQRVLGDSVGVHFTWKPRMQQVQQALRGIETVLRPLRPMPHWAKIFDPSYFDLPRRFGQELIAFQSEFLDRYDPHRKFTTDFVRQCLFAAEGRPREEF